jgi:hypothetical protein
MLSELRHSRPLLGLLLGMVQEVLELLPILQLTRVLLKAADRFINTYGREYPAAVACLSDDLDALLAIHRVPVRHLIRLRTRTWPNTASKKNAAGRRSSRG